MYKDEEMRKAPNSINDTMVDPVTNELFTLELLINYFYREVNRGYTLNAVFEDQLSKLFRSPVEGVLDSAGVVPLTSLDKLTELYYLLSKLIDFHATNIDRLQNFIG